MVPPQSTSVSLPFSTLSLHEGAAHTALTQTRLVQSAPRMQCRPGAQAGQAPPPQSTSVSLPSLPPSEQPPFAAHTALTHEPLRQSASTRQLLPSAQAGQAPPPQSTSVSLPSLI